MLPNEIEQLLFINCVFQSLLAIYIYHDVSQTVLPIGSPNTYYIETAWSLNVIFQSTMFNRDSRTVQIPHEPLWASSVLFPLPGTVFFLGKYSQTLFFCLPVNNWIRCYFNNLNVKFVLGKYLIIASLLDRRLLPGFRRRELFHTVTLSGSLEY